MSNPVKNPPETARVSYSIARRLGSRLFFRLLSTFLSLDIMLLCVTGVSLVMYAESAAAQAVRELSGSGTVLSSLTGELHASGATVTPVSDDPGGFRMIRPFSELLPEATRDASRQIDFDESLPFPQQLDTVRYNIFIEKGLVWYKASVDLGVFLHFFRYALAALLVYELLALMSRSARDRHIVRRALEPISALSETARALNQAGHELDVAKMAALAGKLEGINASRLDTRIQVDETQEELKNLAGAINGMLDRINESYRAQARFVSDASHELRTPISVIQGYANLLDRWGKHDEKALQESITAIKDEATGMKDLVEQLLFLARGDSNTIRLQPEAFDLGALAGEVVRETRLIDTAHQFHLAGGSVTVSADRALIKQALRILVDNAIKYTNSGGNITVTAIRESDHARLTVTDDGIGISPEIVPQVFERFYRADASRARATGGAGLGLSIASWISARHGGHMEALSREGIGTKITIALPISGPGTAPDTDGNASQPAPIQGAAE